MIPATEEMTNFTFKMDKKTRERYSALCEALGFSMSAATLALVRQAVRSQGMSFSLRDENGFTPTEVAELKHRIEDVKKGSVVQHNNQSQSGRIFSEETKECPEYPEYDMNTRYSPKGT